VILETNAVAVLICYLAGIIERRIFVYNHWRWFEYVDEEHTEKQSNEERQKMQIVEEFHFPYFKQGK
jgi:hypothetical protein